MQTSPGHSPDGKPDQSTGIRAEYDRSADSWDETFAAEALNPYHVLACWRAFERALGSDFRGTTAVELGVGTGLFTDRLAPRFDRLIAVDFSSQMLEILRAKLERMKIANVDYLCSAAEALVAVPSGSADAVVCAGLLENIADPYPLFDEVRRVLRPGGRFAGIVSNAACPWYKLRSRISGDKWYWQDVHLFTTGELTEAANAAGLQKVAIKGWGLIPSQMPSSALLAPIAAAERLIEQTPLARWMGGLAFRFDAPQR